MINVSMTLDEIKTFATENGVEDCYLLKTTLSRYEEQTKIADMLKRCIDEHGEYLKKEYVKGRENLVLNPAIGEYNRTSNAINQTGNALIKIITAIQKETEEIEDIEDDEL